MQQLFPPQKITVIFEEQNGANQHVISRTMPLATVSELLEWFEECVLPAIGFYYTQKRDKEDNE